MKTIRQVADMFSVHENTVKNWISKGKLKAITIDRTVRIDDEEIEKLKKGD